MNQNQGKKSAHSKPLSWREIRVIAYGMGLHPWELDEYTMNDFVLRREGYYDKEVEEWRRARFIAYHTVMISGKMIKKKSLKETDLLELPGEKPKKQRIAEDKEKIKLEAAEKLARLDKMNWNKTSVTGKKK